MRFAKEVVVFVVVVSCGWLSARALFHEGFFRTIDDVTPVRINYLARELRSPSWISNFPVRFSAELAHGYGYPLYLFYAPLSYYAGGILIAFGNVSDIIATKAIYALPLLLGPLLAYLAARQHLPKVAAITVTSLYSFFPFRGFDTYLRGGVGESWAMTFLPGVFLGLFLLEQKRHRLWGAVITTVFLTFTILSHNAGGVLVVGLTLLYGLIFLPRVKQFWLSLILALCSTAFYWLPALSYTPLVKVNYSAQNTGSIVKFLTPLSELITVHPYKLDDKFTPPLTLLLLICALICLVKAKQLPQPLRRRTIYWLLSSLILFILPLDLAQPFWSRTLTLTRFLQFPWRVYLLASFAMPLLAGYAVASLKSPLSRWLLWLTCLLALVYSFPAFAPREYSYFYNYSAEDTGECATSWGEEYLPLWVQECVNLPSPFLLYTTPPLQEVPVQVTSPYSFTAKTNFETPTQLYVAKYFFPGWQVKVDGQTAASDYTFYKHGTFRSLIPAGTHTVEVGYHRTLLMWVSDLLSLFGVLCICGTFIYAVKKVRKI